MLYEVITVISDLGLTDINGTPDFQDATYKINLPTKQMGTFSLFGVAGLSRITSYNVCYTKLLRPHPGLYLA